MDNTLMQMSSASYETFVSTANRVPVLTPEEEMQLFNSYLNDGDLSAGNKIINANLRYVINVANGYKGYNLPIADLVQEGCVGLLKALDKFDLSHQVRFFTFAIYHVKASIHEYVIKNYKMMKVATTKAQRKLFFNLKSSKDKHGWLNHQEVEELAKKLDVEPSDVVEMEARLTLTDDSFDGYADDGDSEGEDMETSPSQYLTDDAYDTYAIIANKDSSDKSIESMFAIIDDLDDRTRHIVKSRWLSDEKVTFKELGEKYGVSVERVRQIESSAFGKIREAIPQ